MLTVLGCTSRPVTSFASAARAAQRARSAAPTRIRGSISSPPSTRRPTNIAPPGGAIGSGSCSPSTATKRPSTTLTWSTSDHSSTPSSSASCRLKVIGRSAFTGAPSRSESSPS